MEPDFEPVQPRLQARLARLPQEDAWVRLAAVRGLAAYLEAARTTELGPWVSGFGVRSDAHGFDRSCRRLLLEAVREAARWVPSPWAEAVLWSRWLVYLPELEAWLRGGPVPAWDAAAADLAATLVPEGPGGARELVDDAAVFQAARRDGRPLLRTWAEQWHRRWPACAPDSLAELAALERLVGRHGEGFPALAPREAWGARRALRRAVLYLFRRSSQSPAAVFAYLLMLALDLERLRADLTRRSLFPLPEAA